MNALRWGNLIFEEGKLRMGFNGRNTLPPREWEFVFQKENDIS